ncbi:hypothetical protein GQ600_19314 [Phytophthora cactorum]|nr:hypothetical protein GQ600_19314 [Phytophthora cactorum]
MKTLARKKRYVYKSLGYGCVGAGATRADVREARELTQTSQLHEWNLESLQRALEWACAAEDAVGGAGRRDAHPSVVPSRTLPTLPLDKALTADALRLARIHLLRSILQSPFLASHPTRSECWLRCCRSFKADVKTLQVMRWKSIHPIGVVGAPRTDAMLAIARRMSERCKHVRVQGWVLVTPLKSYALSPRTLQLKAMAKTLQRNAVDARAAVNPETYRCFLDDLRGCFEAPESKDVRVKLSQTPIFFTGANVELTSHE